MGDYDRVRQEALLAARVLQAANSTPDKLVRRFHQEVMRKGWLGSRKPSQWRQGEEVCFVGWLVFRVTLHVEEAHTLGSDGWGNHYEKSSGYEIWLSPDGELRYVSFSRSFSSPTNLSSDEYEIHAPASDEDLRSADIDWLPVMTTAPRPPSSPLEERDRHSSGRRIEPPGRLILQGLELVRSEGRSVRM